jgi:hypothetical protein
LPGNLHREDFLMVLRPNSLPNQEKAMSDCGKVERGLEAGGPAVRV